MGDSVNDEIILLKSDIKRIKDDIYDHGVRLKVLQDTFIEINKTVEMFSQELKIFNRGKEIINKQEKDNKDIIMKTGFKGIDVK